MRRRTTTRWYVGAWVVSLVAVIGLALARHGSAWTIGSVPPAAILAYWVIAVAGLVMLVMWLAALLKLARLRWWGWFAIVLLPHLVGLGIIGMVAYAISGPEDDDEVVYRPTTT